MKEIFPDHAVSLDEQIHHAAVSKFSDQLKTRKELVNGLISKYLPKNKTVFCRTGTLGRSWAGDGQKCPSYGFVLGQELSWK